MARIVGIGEQLSLEPARRSVARDDMEMGMAVLVLQKGIVEMIGLERGPEGGGRPPDLSVEVAPLGGIELSDYFDMTAGYQKALP
jgi:hypothetical protein